MNENVDSLMIRLVGLALAVLMMAGMTIYTGLFPKASAKAADTHAAVISVQEGYVAAGRFDLSGTRRRAAGWECLSGRRKQSILHPGY